MTEARRTRSLMAPELTQLQWDYLNDAIATDDPRRSDQPLKWRFYELNANRTMGTNEPICARLWAAYGPEIVAGWVKERPGTRPSCWWRFEGPDGPDGMASCVPPASRQAAKLERLGVLTPAEQRLRPQAQLGAPNDAATPVAKRAS